MAKAVPSINEPFVNSEGKITDIWYKYLLLLGFMATPSEGGSDENEIPTMGKIFTSLLPITDDDNIHLLNGDLLSYSDEKYQNFIDYIATLVTDYPDLFCTEVEYQASISTYGICGKFVYDEENQTVRLPLTIKREIVAKKEPTDDDKSWYNLYSDGFIEQGGQATWGGNNNFEVNLSIEMINTNYVVNLQTVGGSHSGNNNGVQVYQLFTTKFSCAPYDNDHLTMWEVWGYANTSLIPDIQFQTQYDYIIINDLTNITMQKYLDASAGRTIDRYINTTSKPELDSYTDSKINEINQTANDVISRLLASDRNISFMKYEWDDKIRNDISWLRANTFSWQDGTVYEGVYNHLVDDIDGKTLQSETVAGITIQYYEADDTHKIAPASEENNILDLFNSTGTAWYYILDTDNQRFKLPRKRSSQIVESYRNGLNWYRLYADGWVEQGGYLPITATSTNYYTIDLIKPMENTNYSILTTLDKGTTNNDPSSRYLGHINGTKTNSSFVVRMDQVAYTVGLYWKVSGSSNMDMSNFQADEKYLYFYVGDFTHTAIENTAGLNADLFNGKADIDLNNTPLLDYIIEQQLPNAGNNYTWYNKYKSGKVEQGGYVTASNVKKISAAVNLPVTMSDTNFFVFLSPQTIFRTSSSAWNVAIGYHILSESSVAINSHGIGDSDLQIGLSWKVEGIAAS